MNRLFATTLLLSASALTMVPAAVAQQYPARPVTIIVPYAAGGATDLLARYAAQGLTTAFGSSVVVENKPGASGLVGTTLVARAQPDGYTLLASSSATTVNGALSKTLPFNVRNDFIPIGMIGWGDVAILTNKALPVKTLAEFIEYAKARPGALNFGTAGKGTGAHLSALEFMGQTGIKATHVPYSGSSAVLTGLVGGQVDFAVDVPGGYAEYVKRGDVRALVVTGPERSHLMPDVPTVKEAGYPTLAYTFMIGLMAPAKTPAAVIEKVRSELWSVTRQPEVQKRMLGLNFKPDDGARGSFEKLISDDLSYYERVGSERGFKLED
ncbi:MAG: Bug family tripartite tricarboxylate transporter substrate binding protein [Lautropia sp.]